MTNPTTDAPPPAARFAAFSHAVLAGALMLAPLIGAFTPLGMAPLLVIVGAIAALAVAPHGFAALKRDRLVLAIALFCLWAIASSVWSLDKPQAVMGASKLLLNTGLGLALIMLALGRPHLPNWVITGAAVSVALLAVEYSTDHLVSKAFFALRAQEAPPGKSVLNRGVSVLAMLCWPLLGITLRQRGRVVAMAAAVLVGATIIISDNSTAKAAFLAAAAAAAATWAAPIRTPRLLSATFVAVLLAAPLLPPLLPSPQQIFDSHPTLPTSLHHRLTIWKFAAERTAERPLAGWGFDAARSIPDGESVLEIYSPAADGTMQVTLSEQLMPLHPHNAPLQIWMETGGVGVVLMAAVLWLLVKRCATLPAAGLTRSVAMASITAGFIIANMSFGFWQSWWQAALWITAANIAALHAMTARRP